MINSQKKKSGKKPMTTEKANLKSVTLKQVGKDKKKKINKYMFGGPIKAQEGTGTASVDPNMARARANRLAMRDNFDNKASWGKLAGNPIFEELKAEGRLNKNRRPDYGKSTYGNPSYYKDMSDPTDTNSMSNIYSRYGSAPEQPVQQKPIIRQQPQTQQEQPQPRQEPDGQPRDYSSRDEILPFGYHNGYNASPDARPVGGITYGQGIRNQVSPELEDGNLALGDQSGMETTHHIGKGRNPNYDPKQDAGALPFGGSPKKRAGGKIDFMFSNPVYAQKGTVLSESESERKRKDAKNKKKSAAKKKAAGANRAQTSAGRRHMPPIA